MEIFVESYYEEDGSSMKTAGGLPYQREKSSQGQNKIHILTSKDIPLFSYGSAFQGSSVVTAATWVIAMAWV